MPDSSHPSSDHTSETSAGEEVSTSRLSPGTVPGVIGHYSVKRLIGSGGMGAVYEAVQEHPRRIVALKVMRRGISSRSALRRFEYEAQLLARLRHPGIAQVYEAGAHDDGAGAVPYFAMEFIPAARPLTEYANQRKLSARERLELFLKVCDAVHHGHTKGVIHRDLKPANILVDSSGHAKIIDFGVARATDSDLAVTTLQTDVGQLIGTLQYMSPEQAGGSAADAHDIDTRSDVYSLGVVLYELLTGRLPYDLSGSGMLDAARIVRDQAPARPSTINHALRGDLETITLKALEKDRDRRYRSASELAEDIGRYLGSEPIAARPPSIAYQLRMFTRRNRALVVAVSGAMLLLIAAIVGTSWGLVQVNGARARAIAQADNAKALNDFMTDMLTLASPARAQGNQVTVREALDLASQRLSSFTPAQAEVEAGVRAVIGNIYRSLGMIDAAEPHLRRALDIRRQRLGSSAPDTLISETDLALLLNDRGRSAEAAQMLRDTLAAQERAAGADSSDTLRTASALGWVLRDQGKSAEAEGLFRRALDGQVRTAGADSARAVKAMTELAMVLVDEKKLDAAAPLLERAVEVARRVLGERHPDYLYTLNTRGWLLYTQGKYEEAIGVFSAVVQSARQVLPADHAWRILWESNLGWACVNAGQYERAEATFREVLEPARRLLGEQHRETIRATLGLAIARAGLKRFDEAERMALDANAAAAARGPAWLESLSLDALARIYTLWDRPADAARYRAMIPPEK